MLLKKKGKEMSHNVGVSVYYVHECKIASYVFSSYVTQIK